jgi:anti-anti-sigma regulatory factor
MFDVHTDKLGSMAVLECEGSLVPSDAALKLRDAITSQSQAKILILELSEVCAIAGCGLGMLVFLQRWAHDHDISLKLFNPSRFVREKLEMVSALSEFQIATLHEVMALLGKQDHSFALAA